jgi:isoleucyl-tRNA synthetase
MDLNFPELEKKTLRLWKDNGTFEESVLRRKKAPDFVFYEGPPTANGKPGIHHVLSRVFKDVVCRYKTMQGFRVLRKAGWDTHGLPVELEVEKKLGLKNKKDIEKYGITKFNRLCRQSVWNYLQDWEKLTERVAFWLDMKKPYITYENGYMETVWWIIKQLHQKGFLYQGYRAVPYCPRCGTVLSSHEVAQGYKTTKDPAIYVKLKIKDSEFNGPNSYLLVWTTTPWTLPGNVAVAVNFDIVYVVARVNGEKLILAKERLSVLEQRYEVLKEFKGKELLGLQYEPLYKFSKPDKKSWFVVSGKFVSTEEGTGLVHIAPAFGEEDMAVGRENDLPILLNVDEEGKFKKEVKDWQGLFVKEADTLIINELKKRGLLFKEEAYEHEYPFCWRCGSPLLYYAKQSWFINMQGVKKDLLANNRKINWVPSHLKEGRFGEWLREVKDWAFSRERYWGTPLPVWKCEKCGRIEVVGSKKDLVNQAFSTNKYFILRHGHSLRNAKNIISSWPEKFHSPLTKKGEKEVEKTAKKLKKIDLIFSSDLLRTKQTAQIVSRETGAKIIFDKRIRELDMGELNGKPVKEAGRFWDKEQKLSKVDYYLKRFEVKAPGGENWLDAKKRMYGFLKEINEKYQKKNIVIISHELPLTMLEGAVKGLNRKETIESREKSQVKTGECRKLDFKILPYDEKQELDLHRPFIDQVKFYCPSCGENLMARSPEVVDCWFDSGSMPFAQYHFPFGEKIQFPADFISEAIDQTRGWFYTLLAISTLLGKGLCYKNVISLGHVLDEKGEKMSKSKGNIVDPWYIVEKYGADAVRWYFYTVNQPGEPKLFSEKDVDLALKKFILTFWNSFQFFQTYKGDVPCKKKNVKAQFKTGNLLDEWIISRLNETIREVTDKLDGYDVTGAARAIENFIINDLSLWYIRRSRKRFAEAENTLRFVLSTLSKLTAPFIPFLSEEIYKETKSRGSKTKNSVHLEDWPKADKKLINKKLSQGMERVRGIVALSLAERAKAGIKVRQPLQKLEVPQKMDKKLLDLIKEEVNVKQIVFGKRLRLDTEITPELKEEGQLREIIRNIQEMRKKAELKPKDEISVRYSGSGILNEIIIKNKSFILKEAKIKKLISGEKMESDRFDAEKEVVLDNQNLWLAIKKL